MKWKIEKQRNNDLICQLLRLRGITDKDLYFNPPHPSSLTVDEVGLDRKALEKGMDRINQAIEQKEPIVVYGDYDVDGITGTAVMWEVLHSLGAVVFPYIPDRKSEGYGFSNEGIKTIMQEYNPSLIISVDHGITAEKEVAYLAKEGMDVIVTDHHQPPTEKEVNNLANSAKAVIHTTSLSGAGVAWYMACLLNRKEEKEHLGLAAFGTIADIVALAGPNRQIARYGLEVLTATQRVGLRALKKEAGIMDVVIEPYHISYILGPRINAAGRIEHAIDALRLLCTNNEESAEDLARKLGAINRKRQQILQDQLDYSLENLNSVQDLPRLLILADETYEEGIIGLIAGKLTERYWRPTIVISQNPEGISKASARSIPGVNIIDLIRKAKNLLLGVGGHPMAAGFTVETSLIPTLAEDLLQIASNSIEEGQLEKVLKIDAEIKLSEIKKDFYDKLKQFAPFGRGNPEPLFCTRGAYLENVRSVGADGKHLKFTTRGLNAIAFGRGYLLKKLNLSEPVDLAYTLSLNHWNGRDTLQLKVRDIKQEI